MVALTSRFMLLAALCAAVSMGPMVPTVDASVLAVRQLAVDKGKVSQAVPLPNKEADSADHHHHHHHHHDKREIEQAEHHHHHHHQHDSREVDDAEHRHHHHHHHHDRRDDGAEQYPVSMKRLIKRRHRKHHHDKARATDSTSNEKLSSNDEERLEQANADDTWDPLDPIIGIGNTEIGDGRDGEYSNTHYLLGDGPILIKRAPHSHHHHHHHDRRSRHEHDDGKTGDLLDMGIGIHMGSGCTMRGRHMRCGHIVRSMDKSAVSADMDGVPGTVEVMNISPAATPQRLASLVLSSVSGNGTANATLATNGTKMAYTSDSPFVLDASNNATTKFFLVVDPPVETVVANGTFNQAFEALNETTTTEDNMGSDIKVTLQVPVFESDAAKMVPYCATFDPDPPAPAPLTMEECYSNSLMSDYSGPHKSQKFAYNADTGFIRPLWTAKPSASVSNSTNSTQPQNATYSTPVSSNTTTTVPTSSPSGLDANFVVHQVIKGAVLATNASQPANVTAPVNSTAPTNATAPSQPATNSTMPNPQNVTLVFVPAVDASVVHNANTAFTPLGSDSDSDTPTDADSTDSSDETGSSSASVSAGTVSTSLTSSTASMSASSDSSVATTTDSIQATISSSTELSADSTDVPQQADVEPTPDSDASPSLTSGSSTSMTTTDSGSSTSSTLSTLSSTSTGAAPSSNVDPSAIEQMYQIKKQSGGGF